MSRPPENTKALPSKNADLAELAGIHQAKPRTKDVLERFRHRVKWGHRDEETGKWVRGPVGGKYEIDLKTRKEVKEWSEMRDGFRAKAVSRAHRVQGSIPTVRMRAKNGEVREVATNVAHHAEKNGMQWAPRRRPTASFVYHEDGRVERVR